jgi:hypothetical protein
MVRIDARGLDLRCRGTSLRVLLRGGHTGTVSVGMPSTSTMATAMTVLLR